MTARVAVIVAALGASACGRIGFEPVTGEDRPAPRPRLAISDGHACAIRAGDELWCWGQNSNGELGRGAVSVAEDLPGRVVGAPGWTAVCAGSGFSCGLRDARLWCWGSASGGQLGTGVTTGQFAEPQPVGTDSWRALACQGNHGCAVRADQSIWCWGDSLSGEVGIPGGEIAASPIPLTTSAGWSEIHVGYNFGLALGASGVAMWGSNEESQFGDGDTLVGADHPIARHDLGFEPMVVAVGREHVCAGDPAGALRCWGDNRQGQIGVGTLPQDETMPRIVPDVTGIELVAAGGHTSCVIAAGTLWCWGANDFGGLGLGDAGLGTERLVPTQVTADADWTAIAIGLTTTCGERGGELYCWGNNANGALGIGSLAASSALPVGPLAF